MTSETVKTYSRANGWQAVTVPAYAAPRETRPARRTARPMTPRSSAPLSDGSPFAADTRQYTAYDQAWSQAADTRTYVPPAAMRTHRKPTVAPSRDTQPQPRRAPRTAR